MLKFLKILCHVHTLLVMLTEKKFWRCLIKKNYKKQIKKNLDLKK